MKIKSLNGQFFNYSYVEKRDYETILDRFLRSTLIAVDFLYRTNVLTLTFMDENVPKRVDIIDVLVSDTTNDISIIPGDRNAYNPKLNAVTFYDTHGVVFRKNHKKKWFQSNKGYNSPVALLSHELIHCYNELYDTEDYLARKRDQTSRGRR